jgi:S1-C subfamily serine protease
MKAWTLATLSATVLLTTLVGRAGAVPPVIAEAEARRLAAIEKVRGSVVAIFGRGGGGGGSGVLISPDGYALTNFHVVQPAGKFMKCGLADGVLYDAVMVGLDPVGDVALIKLLPQEPNKPFPCATLGDSDKVRIGDWVLAMGNPFLLATDFTPTITYGLVSGVNRYQYPAGTILEYTDCIQIDASINPGNSGGPLFNLDGEIIGINGRGSFEKRGRVNSGVGYAISINQIKNFLGHLRGGLLVDHATLGAVVRTDEEGRLVVRQILENSDARRRGLDVDDELVSFAGRPMTSVNQFKNVLGIYPKGWRLPLVYRRTDEERNTTTTHQVLVRLLGVGVDRQLEERQPRPIPGQPPEPPQPGQPRRPPGQPPMPPQEDDEKPEEKRESPAAKFYEEKKGFANYYFNRLERDRLLAEVKKLGDFSGIGDVWRIEGERVQPVKDAFTAAVRPGQVRLTLGEQEYALEPLKPGESLTNLREPRDSGGLMAALYVWRRFLEKGPEGFEIDFHYGGYEPFYPDGTAPSRVDCEVLVAEHGPFYAKWYFRRIDGQLLGMETYTEKDHDPCEITFGDYRDVDGRKLPHRLEVRYAGKDFGIFVIKTHDLKTASDSKEKQP